MTVPTTTARKKRKMTNRQALKEAVRRWGKNGSVIFNPRSKEAERSYRVGKVEMGMFFGVKGQGATWEDAFADADKTERFIREKYGRKGATDPRGAA